MSISLTKEPPLGGILAQMKLGLEYPPGCLVNSIHIDLPIILEPKGKSSTKKALINQGFFT